MTGELATLAPSDTCPPWCVRDERYDADSANQYVHDEDAVTWHHGNVVAFPTSCDTTLTLLASWYDPDVKQGDDPPPEIEISGNDGSGSMVGLRIRADDLRSFAAALVGLADAFEVTR